MADIEEDAYALGTEGAEKEVKRLEIVRDITKIKLFNANLCVMNLYENPPLIKERLQEQECYEGFEVNE